MRFFKKIYVTALKKTDLASAIAVRLTKITGKSKYPIHPKHLLEQNPWFTKYLEKKDTLIDLGAGNGQNTIKAAKLVKKVIAVEVDDRLFKIARLSAKSHKKINIAFRKLDLEEKLPYKNNSFTKAIFLDVLEHLSNREQVLRELKRILKPGGLLFLGVPNSATSWKKMQRSVGICSFSDPDHKIEFTENLIRKLLSRHKFKIVKLDYGKYDIPIRGLIDIIGVFSINFYKKIHSWRAKKGLLEPQNASGFEIICENIK